jgi:hypothetical protein
VPNLNAINEGLSRLAREQKCMLVHSFIKVAKKLAVIAVYNNHHHIGLSCPIICFLSKTADAINWWVDFRDHHVESNQLEGDIRLVNA